MVPLDLENHAQCHLFMEDLRAYLNVVQRRIMKPTAVSANGGQQ
jgi:hypothetical protein